MQPSQLVLGAGFRSANASGSSRVTGRGACSTSARLPPPAAVAAFAEEGDASGDSPDAGAAPSGPGRVGGTSAGRGERSRFGPSDARRSGSDAALDLSDRERRARTHRKLETADAPEERAPSAGLAAHGRRAREDCARGAPGGLK